MQLVLPCGELCVLFDLRLPKKSGEYNGNREQKIFTRQHYIFTTR